MAKSRIVQSPPVPEAVDHSKPWLVKESVFGGAPRTDFKTGTMVVPLGIAPKDRVLRDREMLKLKFSPKSPPRLPADVDPEIYNACETARVAYRGTRLGIRHEETRVMSDEYIDEMSKKWKESPQIAGAMLMQALGTADAKVIHNRLHEMEVVGDLPPGKYWEIESAVHGAQYYTNRGKAPGPKQAIKAAQILTQILTPPPPPPPGDSDKNSSGPSGGEIAEQVKKGVDSMKQQGGERQIEAMIADATYKHGNKPEMVRVDSAQWGPMTIWEPERPLLFPARLKSKRWRPTDQGSVFRYPHRWTADQTGFAYKGLKEGGVSMLIDVSGSMRLSQEDILTVMEYMPASLIATYSGNSREGKLTIVGKKGRRAEEHNFRTAGGNNLVDGPALRWLAEQKGPRYWISDGYVTGIEGHTPRLYADAILVCRQAHIMRIDSMAAVIEKFESYGYGKRRK